MLRALLRQALHGRPRTDRRTRVDEASERTLQQAIRCFEAGDFVEAHEIARQIVLHHPQDHLAWNLLGAAALALEESESATRHFKQAVALCPADPAYLSNCGEAFRRIEMFEEAENYCRAAIAANPGHAPAHYNLALALDAMGETEAAYAALRMTLDIDPHNRAARSAMVFLMWRHPEIDASHVLAEHRRWDEMHARPFASGPIAGKSLAKPDGVLRVGYVSGDFWQHAVSYFIEPLLANHDPGRFEIHCYHSGGKQDEVTARLRSHVPHWHEVSATSDEALAGQVLEDGIDILVDLSGYTKCNRLLTFARKPAPLQVSYLGYLNTTGLGAMDYRITDGLADPIGISERYHTERLARMPHSLWCYRPPADAPEANALPALENGAITFGSLHNLSKLNRRVIELWARLLIRQPDARLLIGGVKDPTTKRRLWVRFAALGIQPERLQLVGTCSFADYWRLYHRIDITLDAFPYNGATTTCESLWMGVPVVTLAGEYAAARSGVSLLTSVGLSDLIACSEEQYIGIAVGLAGDVPRLRALRESLRGRMQASPLMDEQGHTRAFEALLRSMVRRAAAGRT